MTGTAAAGLCLRSPAAGAVGLLILDERRPDADFGGHKARRLGPRVRDAAEARVPLLTAGGDGSQQVAAAAALGAVYDVPIGVVTWPQPGSPARAAVRDHLRRRARWHVEVEEPPQAAAALAHLAAALGGGAAIVGPGAAAPADLGPSVALGAALAHALPATDAGRPWVLVLPVGSGGTAAAWRAGLDAAGRADVAVLGVRAVPRRAMGPGRLQRLREALGGPAPAGSPLAAPLPSARPAGPGLWLCGPSAAGAARDGLSAWVDRHGEPPLEAIYEAVAAPWVRSLHAQGHPVIWARTAAPWP